MHDDLNRKRLSADKKKLDLSDATIPAGLVIPDSVTTLDLRYATIPADAIHTDPRGYRLHRLRRGATGEIWFAGCRVFFCRGDALAHWGGDTYPDKGRGAGFVAAIKATPPFGDDDA